MVGWLVTIRMFCLCMKGGGNRCPNREMSYLLLLLFDKSLLTLLTFDIQVKLVKPCTVVLKFHSVEWVIDITDNAAKDPF